ncbi:hypothetical protein OJ253_1957 [Cryptosporidium canis]|uniref:Uncharacterized protein n=1 Tax=Cryptosporidium canis TaxID=195482 RepID=A0A9D5DIG5_9CRYT|nr:hypothetical protein OJ253_1957 [Cryptosporidium canis]
MDLPHETWKYRVIQAEDLGLGHDKPLETDGMHPNVTGQPQLVVQGNATVHQKGPSRLDAREIHQSAPPHGEQNAVKPCAEAATALRCHVLKVPRLEIHAPQALEELQPEMRRALGPGLTQLAGLIRPGGATRVQNAKPVLAFACRADHRAADLAPEKELSPGARAAGPLDGVGASSSPSGNVRRDTLSGEQGIPALLERVAGQENLVPTKLTAKGPILADYGGARVDGLESCLVRVQPLNTQVLGPKEVQVVAHVLHLELGTGGDSGPAVEPGRVDIRAGLEDGQVGPPDDVVVERERNELPVIEEREPRTEAHLGSNHQGNQADLIGIDHPVEQGLHDPKHAVRHDSRVIQVLILTHLVEI